MTNKPIAWSPDWAHGTAAPRRQRNAHSLRAIDCYSSTIFFEPCNHQFLDLRLIRNIAQARLRLEGREQIFRHLHTNEPRLAGNVAVHASEIVKKSYDIIMGHFTASLEIIIGKFLHRSQSSCSRARTSSRSCGRALSCFILINSLRSRI